ncbi:sodium:calcium antiporter, partial [Candidatus Peregrinibacteria bacterium]|nr:sodium:calcium antiporter [Candidatus Peregrinibacteria bacterium]
MIAAGLIGVIVGAQWVVEGARVIARELSWSEGLIGLTIVGIGTSLPELAISFTAALRREPGIAIGNIIGSNIFDFFMILGFSSLIKPISFPQTFLTDMGVVALAALFLYGLMFTGERYTLKRWEGISLVVLYIF